MSTDNYSLCRFALTRAWFEISVGSPSNVGNRSSSWLLGTIVDTQEVISNEIWSVTVSFPRDARMPATQETLYVLEATCEVVGRPNVTGPQAESPGNVAATATPLRADWSAYISRRVASGECEAQEPPLLSHLKWACEEEYDRGISKAWLKRIYKGEGLPVAPERIVAERYVLACVAANRSALSYPLATSCPQVDHPRIRI